MAGKVINVLVIADIIGQPGLDIASHHVQQLIQENAVTLTIANGENAASGKGITPHIMQSFRDIGIDVITSGNHIWDKDKIYDKLDSDDRILRPLNYPDGCPGHGSCIVNTPFNAKIGVISLQGRSFMYPIDCPFKAMDKEIEYLKSRDANIILVDFHAESTAEKIAMGWHLNGRVTAVIGSHTHVQTADEQILSGGTAYITDMGMSGPFDSVIGMDKQSALKRFLTQMPVRYKTAFKDVRLNGVLLGIDIETNKSVYIKRIQLDAKE